MISVKIRNVEIGQDMPVICVPVTGVQEQEIEEQAHRIAASDFAHMAEWRADWFEGVWDSQRAKVMLKKLREILGAKPLLFTFRSEREGGAQPIDLATYRALNLSAAKSGCADIIDVEAFFPGISLVETIAELHPLGVKVISSNHDFDQTPEKDELMKRLMFMEEGGADLLKIAAMPRSARDVLTLLEATLEMKEISRKPIVTMSMSGLGTISRLSGEIFGSSITFGTLGAISAPGQMDADLLNRILTMIHEGLR